MERELYVSKMKKIIFILLLAPIMISQSRALTFIATDIATSADGASSVFVADMDGDGDMDIVSASQADDTIAWYENNSA